MHIERMRAVAADVLAHAEQFEMSWWFIDDRDTSLPSQIADIPADGLDHCGTTCCIAGAAVLRALSEGEAIDPQAGISETAAAYLGLETSERFQLFHVGNWYEDLGERYRNSESRLARAQAAVEQIERMIAEEEAAPDAS